MQERSRNDRYNSKAFTAEFITADCSKVTSCILWLKLQWISLSNIIFTNQKLITSIHCILFLSATSKRHVQETRYTVWPSQLPVFISLLVWKLWASGNDDKKCLRVSTPGRVFHWYYPGLVWTNVSLHLDHLCYMF